MRSQSVAELTAAKETASEPQTETGGELTQSTQAKTSREKAVEDSSQKAVEEQGIRIRRVGSDKSVVVWNMDTGTQIEIIHFRYFST